MRVYLPGGRLDPFILSAADRSSSKTTFSVGATTSFAEPMSKNDMFAFSLIPAQESVITWNGIEEEEEMRRRGGKRRRKEDGKYK